jgi:ADP-L-glycero-D-manno-heptose 6-epimerase
MIVVTGGAGFIGSNLIRGLNDKGLADIVVVDDLTDGRKFRNLVDCAISDYWDKDAFFDRVLALKVPPSAVFHQGACAVTTDWDGRRMLADNYQYSVDLLHYCLAQTVPLIYASSAAVYGASQRFDEGDPTLEKPLNVYGYSKLLFDRYVRRNVASEASQVVGLRYFNVYGPREAHKESMASVAFHFNRQLQDTGVVQLFEGSDGYQAGEQRRDFVYVSDVVKVNLWLLEHADVSGIFNVGTGASASFNELARAVIGWHGRGEIRYKSFPDALRGSYQSFTEADMARLRAAGCKLELRDVNAGVKAYLDALQAQP